MIAITKILIILLSALLLINSKIVPFDGAAIDKVFSQNNPTLTLFTTDNEASAAAKIALAQYDETNPSMLLTICHSENNNNKIFDKLTSYMGVDINQLPKIMYMSADKMKYKFDSQQINKDTLASFVARIQAGQIQVFLRSAAIPETNDELVKIAVGKNFKELVLDSDKEFLVYFYAPWCGHCKNLNPHYDQAAKLLAKNPNIILVKMNSIQNQILGFDIRAFPTLKFWRKDKSVAPIDYTGQKNTEGIISWLQEHTQNEWVDIISKTDENTAAKNKENTDL